MKCAGRCGERCRLALLWELQPPAFFGSRHCRTLQIDANRGESPWALAESHLYYVLAGCKLSLRLDIVTYLASAGGLGRGISSSPRQTYSKPEGVFSSSD